MYTVKVGDTVEFVCKYQEKKHHRGEITDLAGTEDGFQVFQVDVKEDLSWKNSWHPTDEIVSVEDAI